MTCFIVRGCSILPKKELRRSLQVVGNQGKRSGSLPKSLYDPYHSPYNSFPRPCTKQEAGQCHFRTGSYRTGFITCVAKSLGFEGSRVRRGNHGLLSSVRLLNEHPMFDVDAHTPPFHV